MQFEILWDFSVVCLNSPNTRYMRIKFPVDVSTPALYRPADAYCFRVGKEANFQKEMHNQRNYFR